MLLKCIDTICRYYISIVMRHIHKVLEPCKRVFASALDLKHIHTKDSKFSDMPIDHELLNYVEGILHEQYDIPSNDVEKVANRERVHHDQVMNQGVDVAITMQIPQVYSIIRPKPRLESFPFLLPAQWAETTIRRLNERIRTLTQSSKFYKSGGMFTITHPILWLQALIHPSFVPIEYKPSSTHYRKEHTHLSGNNSIHSNPFRYEFS